MTTDTAKKAAALYKVATALMDEAAELLKGDGVKVYTGIKRSYRDVEEPSVLLGCGIKKLTNDESEIKPMPPMWRGEEFEPDATIGWIEVDGVSFYQYKRSVEEHMTLE